MKNPPLIWLKTNWFLVVATISVVGMWTTLSNKVESHTEAIANLRQVDESFMLSNQQIFIKLAEIQKDIAWIKEKIQ